MKSYIMILTFITILTNATTYFISEYYFTSEIQKLNKELQESVKITKLDLGEFIIKGNKMYEVTLMRKETVYR